MTNSTTKPSGSERNVREPSLMDALVPLVVLAGIIGSALYLYELDALDGPIQAGLIVCCILVTIIVLKNKHEWSEVEASGKRGLSSVTSAVFILLSVGALIGTWNLAGTIPTLVYYGLKVLSPTWFYPSVALICAIVALSIGSSWTTAGTIGVGLVSISVLLGVSPAITAGAVISGAYLGDKCSPLSETTVLTSQMVELDIYDHIKRQVWSSVPAFLIGLVLFIFLGLAGQPTGGASDTPTELKALGDIFNISVWTLLPLVLLVVLSIKKVPPHMGLLFSAIFAGALALVLQPGVVEKYITASGGGTGWKAVWSALSTGFSIDSGYPDIDRLVSRGGMSSMLMTLWLIIGAVTFGTLLEDFGLINRLIDPLVRSAKSTGRLFFTVFLCAFGLNVVAGDQYIALVLPARMFRLEFAKRGLAPSNLSRLAADCGTVTSPLVPWNSCGAYMAAVLGVATLSYLPFAFFCIFSPLLSVLYGVTGFKIEKLDQTDRIERREPPPIAPSPSGHPSGHAGGVAGFKVEKLEPESTQRPNA